MEKTADVPRRFKWQSIVGIALGLSLAAIFFFQTTYASKTGIHVPLPIFMYVPLYTLSVLLLLFSKVELQAYLGRKLSVPMSRVEFGPTYRAVSSDRALSPAVGNRFYGIPTVSSALMLALGIILGLVIPNVMQTVASPFITALSTFGAWNTASLFFGNDGESRDFKRYRREARESKVNASGDSTIESQEEPKDTE